MVTLINILEGLNETYELLPLIDLDDGIAGIHFYGTLVVTVTNGVTHLDAFRIETQREGKLVTSLNKETSHFLKLNSWEQSNVLRFGHIFDHIRECLIDTPLYGKDGLNVALEEGKQIMLTFHLSPRFTTDDLLLDLVGHMLLVIDGAVKLDHTVCFTDYRPGTSIAA